MIIESEDYFPEEAIKGYKAAIKKGIESTGITSII